MSTIFEQPKATYNHETRPDGKKVVTALRSYVGRKRSLTHDEFAEKIKSDEGFKFLVEHARNTSNSTWANEIESYSLYAKQDPDDGSSETTLVSGLKIDIPKYCLKFPTFGHNVVKALKLDETDKGDLVAVGFIFHGAKTREMKNALVEFYKIRNRRETFSERLDSITSSESFKKKMHAAISKIVASHTDV